MASGYVYEFKFCSIKLKAMPTYLNHTILKKALNTKCFFKLRNIIGLNAVLMVTLWSP